MQMTTLSLLRSFSLALATMLLVLGCSGTTPPSAPSGPGQISGTVTAAEPFEAAKVYAQHIERNIIYMSYTGKGSYQTVQMFPGTYEVWAEKPGLESARQEIHLEPGAAMSVDLALEQVATRIEGQGT
ncbi:MAG: carboxypeptidase-like regulatory domain-containing protein, partial [Gammaproteobacteria bacterium]